VPFAAGLTISRARPGLVSRVSRERKPTRVRRSWCSLDDHQAHRWILQERPQFWARVIHTGPDCFYYLRHLIPSRPPGGRQSRSLALQVALVLGGRHPCITCHLLPSTHSWRFLTFRHHTGAQINPPSLDFPVAEPAPGGLVAHAHLLGIVSKLH